MPRWPHGEYENASERLRKDVGSLNLRFESTASLTCPGDGQQEREARRKCSEGIERASFGGGSSRRRFCVQKKRLCPEMPDVFSRRLQQEVDTCAFLRPS